MNTAEQAAEGEAQAMSPAEAKASLESLKASAEFWKKHDDGRHPGHRMAVAMFKALHRRAAAANQNEK